MTKNDESKLALEVRVPASPAVLGRPYTVEVALINRSENKVRINRRMAVGYRSHLSREIFAELREEGTDRPPNINEMDYDRDLAGQEDFVYLAPGARLEARFDLLEWYAPDSPGEYNLLIFYAADEPLANAPADTFKGILASEPIKISIRSGKPGAEQEHQG